ncbi:YlzJ-like family protein [Tepidibacillus fermentans]|uniref:YlzJ-like protein n=1 Tax=Tepidibacillus fermentans TaxID=1281767 RepID=A0A4R3KIJ6_9BACI|nr:YlzJ-like family protein [Tepidibacillus fermentans]TCS83004.1 YlzJ-like protein [Tepidibacillus fermentans]
MIHYTPVPLEFVFEGYDQMKFNYKEIQYGHMTMIIEPTSEFEGKLVRLISPNALDYLNPNYQPGTMLTFKPYLL